MSRPFVVCYMLCSLDGRIDGSWFRLPETAPALRATGQIRRDYGCDAVINGAVTCAEIYAEGYVDRLEACRPQAGALSLELDPGEEDLRPGPAHRPERRPLHGRQSGSGELPRHGRPFHADTDPGAGSGHWLKGTDVHKRQPLARLPFMRRNTFFFVLRLFVQPPLDLLPIRSGDQREESWRRFS